MKTVTQTIGACIMLFALAMALAPYLPPPTPNPSPGPGPDPTPEPIPTVESPFPAEGFYLLMASESSDQEGVAVVANAESIRKDPAIDSRWHDYDQVLQPPWDAALRWARQASDGKPYFVLRHGNKAAEGFLQGSPSEMHRTLTVAIEGAR